MIDIHIELGNMSQGFGFSKEIMERAVGLVPSIAQVLVEDCCGFP